MTVIFKGIGYVLDLLISAGCSAGDPIGVGFITGVALGDIASSGTGPIATEGIFDLSVKAINGSGNSAVAIGDKIYWTTGDTPKLNKKDTGALFGFALEAITAGLTDTIKVKLAQGL